MFKEFMLGGPEVEKPKDHMIDDETTNIAPLFKCVEQWNNYNSDVIYYTDKWIRAYLTENEFP